MKTITPKTDETHLAEAVAVFRSALSAAALTGAGISVGSGIADFRSPGGVWTVFAPDEYATLDVFLRHPAKAWQLYREIGKSLIGKKPNCAHEVLADLETSGLLKGLVTQNVDNLHQAAGSRNVLEIHGDDFLSLAPRQFVEALEKGPGEESGALADDQFFSSGRYHSFSRAGA